MKDLNGPWTVTTGHPAAGEHEGHALGIVAGQDDEPISNDTVEVHMRYASCSCGWSGQLRTAPGAREQRLRTRRYRAQTREVLRPEWDAHVAQWLPEPLSAPDPTEDTPATPPEPQGASESPQRRRPSKRTKRTKPVESVAEPEAAAVVVVEDQAVPESDPGSRLVEAAAVAGTAAAAARRANDALTDAVREARQAGISWAKIGAAASMSRQAAHERWRVL
ncbi:hypothetical protein Ae706Ps2_6681 [Pseudonocardia sp. Ae706_Ps2]|nr:hypothetical protein Ae331Ps2_6336c [Pseudonocardia sp. Ae331_Ps2]OLM08708.1 hypothetical protein Ae706Ps2_6681 [Pseudonocardia sp. Ae706_Ps2]